MEKKPDYYSVIASLATSLVVEFVFYVLAAVKVRENPLYMSVDVYAGMIFVFILSMIVSASIWPGIIEKRMKQISMQNKSRNVAYLAIIVIAALYIGFAALVITSPFNDIQQNLRKGEYAVQGSVVSIDTKANYIVVLQGRGSPGLPPMSVGYSLDNLSGTRISDFTPGDNVTLILRPVMNSPDESQSVSRYVVLVRITKT